MMPCPETNNSSSVLTGGVESHSAYTRKVESQSSQLHLLLCFRLAPSLIIRCLIVLYLVSTLVVIIGAPPSGELKATDRVGRGAQSLVPTIG